MNSVNLIGRLTADPDVRYTTNGEPMAIARYTLAVDGIKERTDFIRCVAFGKAGEFAEKYLSKGLKVGISGRIQTGSYKDNDGKMVYTTDIIVNQHTFCESKKEDNVQVSEQKSDEFMKIPDNVDDSGLPFNF